MKARFFLKTPPGGDEQVEYIEIDPDDSGLNKQAYPATDVHKSRFSQEYEAFEKEQEEREESDEVPTDPEPLGAGLPVTMKAAMPLGREEEWAHAQTAQPVPGGHTQNVGTIHADRIQVGDTSGSDDATTAETPAGDSISDLHADEAISDIKATDDKKQLEAWRKEEKGGKARVTVLDAIESQLQKLSHH